MMVNRTEYLCMCVIQVVFLRFPDHFLVDNTGKKNWWWNITGEEKIEEVVVVVVVVTQATIIISMKESKWKKNSNCCYVIVFLYSISNEQKNKNPIQMMINRPKN